MRLALLLGLAAALALAAIGAVASVTSRAGHVVAAGANFNPGD